MRVYFKRKAERQQVQALLPDLASACIHLAKVEKAIPKSCVTCLRESPLVKAIRTASHLCCELPWLI